MRLIQGGYFMVADIRKVAVNFQTDENECKDQKFVKYLTKEKVKLIVNIFCSYFILYLKPCELKGLGDDSHVRVLFKRSQTFRRKQH